MYGFGADGKLQPNTGRDWRTEIRQALGVLDAVILATRVLEARQRLAVRMRSAAPACSQGAPAARA